MYHLISGIVQHVTKFVLARLPLQIQLSSQHFVQEGRIQRHYPRLGQCWQDCLFFLILSFMFLYLNLILFTLCVLSLDLSRECQEHIHRSTYSRTFKDSSYSRSKQFVLLPAMSYSSGVTNVAMLIVGRITLSSSVLQFWDLGGQRDFRAIWPKYYNDCHAVVFVIDSTDRERMEEVWQVFR